ncbi:UxaA family hydrolase [Labrys neptuniae]
MQIDPRLLHLSPLDNVVVARESLAAGCVLMLDGRAFTLAKDVQRGHKIACRSIQPGEKVLKYGAPIGSAVQTIAPGEHVHLHNIKSDYTATHIIGSPAAEAQ